MNTAEMDDQQLLDQVIALVRETGLYQLSRFRALPPGGGEEKIAHEFVSEVDLYSERMLIAGLQQMLPDAGFYGEETGTSGNTALRWVIDPLDGTTNFLSGLDQYCISVALEVDGQSVLGVVLRPASDECFSACRGRGLQRNGLTSGRGSKIPLQRALIGTGFPYRSKDLASSFFACVEEVLYASRGIRRFGSAALDLCYVASGFLQGFWESDLQPYDVAAALLFMRESGCLVTNHQGSDYSPYRDRILVCGAPDVHRELLQIVEKHYCTSF
jgi:myo-inositol-1(or 4)-monophosphatase